MCCPLHDVGTAGRTAGRLCATGRASVIAEAYSPTGAPIIRSDHTATGLLMVTHRFCSVRRAPLASPWLSPDNGSAPPPPQPGALTQPFQEPGRVATPRRGPATICRNITPRQSRMSESRNHDASELYRRRGTILLGSVFLSLSFLLWGGGAAAIVRLQGHLHVPRPASLRRSTNPYLELGGMRATLSPDHRI